MHHSLKPASLLFYLLAAICLFFTGAFLAGITGQAENQGLAGGAIILFYGIIGGGIGFFGAILWAGSLTVARLKKINLGLGILLLIFLAISAWLFYQKNTKTKESFNIKNTDANTLLISNTGSHEELVTADMGFFKPHFFELEKLYFYDRPDFEHSILEQLPADSLTFEITENGGFRINAAPPWLNPAQYKPDYEVLLFEVIGVSRDFVGIIVNGRNGMIRYVDRKAGDFLSWPDFLLQVSSIEPLEPETNPLKIKPLDHASPVDEEFDFIRPLLVQGDWVYGKLLKNDLTENGKAWIRWKNRNQLLIKYSLFM